MRIINRFLRLLFRVIENEKRHQGYFGWPQGGGRIIRICYFALEEIYMLLLMIWAVPVVIVIRILRPFLLIRIRQGSGKRIGAFVSEIEVYLCQRDAGQQQLKGVYDIFYFSLPYCNRQIKKMWQRKIHIPWFPRLTHQIYRLNNFLPGSGAHNIPAFTDYTERDINGLYAHIPTHLVFSSKEEILGRSKLREIGIPEGSRFVCFHVRDSAYLKVMVSGSDWSYHKYRDSDINNYIPALKELTKRGYYVVRMGAAVEDRLKSWDPMVIDYASDYRSDFLDVYLCANCSFFLASNSGIEHVARAFRRPMLHVNCAPFEHMHTSWPTVLVLPKKYRFLKENRFLKFSEVMRSDLKRALSTLDFDRHGVELVENTSDELVSVVIEMDERLRGNWQESPGSEELQSSFLSLFKTSDLHGSISARVGQDFLSKNRYLFV